MFHQNFGGGFGNDDMGPGRNGFLDFLFWKLFLLFIFEFLEFLFPKLLFWDESPRLWWDLWSPIPRNHVVAQCRFGFEFIWIYEPGPMGANKRKVKLAHLPLSIYNLKYLPNQLTKEILSLWSQFSFRLFAPIWVSSARWGGLLCSCFG